MTTDDPLAWGMYEGYVSNHPVDFSIHVGIGSEFEATIDFKAERDICGEGYEGYSFDIKFNDSRFHSPLWSFEDFRTSTQDGAKEEAMGLYNLIVDFIKRMR